MSGPDMVVTELTGVRNYSFDVVDGELVYVYSVGTRSCNVGDEPLAWMTRSTRADEPGFLAENWSRHPLIGQNLYRVHEGRIRQIGQSWVKHGFNAVAEPGCGTACLDIGGGSYLGVGCSDVYGAGVNGTQSAMGPRWEVNPTSGVFPYPFADVPDAGEVYRKRLWSASSELDAGVYPGALYFVESVVIAEDDARRGHGHNNASHRRVGLSSGNSMFLTDTTRVGEPAIFAWRAHGGGLGVEDPGVELTPIDVAGDGRYWVGSDVTEVEPGWWRYEYCVENLNSHRGAKRFVVGLGGGAGVRAVGFADVGYHSGDGWDSSAGSEVNFDGTDWNAVVRAGSVEWSTAGFASDPNGNALRWGTMYCFWFESDVGPGEGAVELGMYRDGSAGEPGGVRVFARTPGGGPVVGGVVNDVCEDAAGVTSVRTGFSLVGAGASGAVGGCAGKGGLGVGADLWYRWRSALGCAEPVTISTCGSGFDTSLSVYDGCPGAGGVLVACNDDNAGACANALGSSVTFVPEPGGEYVIRVGGHGASVGNGELVIEQSGCLPARGGCCLPGGVCVVLPRAGCDLRLGVYAGDGIGCADPGCPAGDGVANDRCVNATPLGDFLEGGAEVTGETFDASVDGYSSCGGFDGLNTNADVWYSYTPARSESVRIVTSIAPGETAEPDTVLSVHSGCGFNAVELACNDDAGEGVRTSEIVTGVLTAGETYLIRVTGYDIGLERFAVRVEGGGGVAQRPANDDCAGANALVGSAAFDTSTASTDGAGVGLCGVIEKDVWFTFTPGVSGNAVIGTCVPDGGSGPEGVAIEVYSGSCGVLGDPLACGMACDGGARVELGVVGGLTYLVRVGSTGGDAVVGVLTAGVEAVEGACCVGLGCVVTTLGGCSSMGGEWDGSAGCGESGCCRADVDLDGFVAVGDLLEFLGAWAVEGGSGDWNGDGVWGVGDILDFLSAWSRGC